MIIDVSEMRRIANHIFDELEKSEIKQFNVEHDYYWFISKHDKYDVYKEPTNFTVGQLADDINELRRTVRGEREVSSYALVWLAQILCYIGECAPPPPLR